MAVGAALMLAPDWVGRVIACLWQVPAGLTGASIGGLYDTCLLILKVSLVRPNSIAKRQGESFAAQMLGAAKEVASCNCSCPGVPSSNGSKDRTPSDPDLKIVPDGKCI